jgi:hypothetical protein
MAAMRRAVVIIIEVVMVLTEHSMALVLAVHQTLVVEVVLEENGEQQE